MTTIIRNNDKETFTEWLIRAALHRRMHGPDLLDTTFGTLAGTLIPQAAHEFEEEVYRETQTRYDIKRELEETYKGVKLWQ